MKNSDLQRWSPMGDAMGTTFNGEWCRYRDAARLVRKREADLRALVAIMRRVTRNLDAGFATRKDIPRDASAKLGELTGMLEFAADSADHFGLGKPLRRKDD